MKIRQSKASNLSTLSRSIDYISNDKKTEGKSLVTCFECYIDTAPMEFELSELMYEQHTGNKFQSNDIISYQIRQSFKPNEITKELAHKLGVELAEKFLKGNHQYIVCTHTDKSHIHNHIIYNAVSLDYKHKFNNYWNTSKAIRQISDNLCKENGLSVVEKPSSKSKPYNEYMKPKKTKSGKMILEECINQIIEDERCKTFEDFITLIKAKGYQVKFGKYISFKANNMERFRRCKSLGEYYTEASIKERIENKKYSIPVSNVDLPIRTQVINKCRTNSQELKDIKKISNLLNFLDTIDVKYYKDIDLKIKEIDRQAHETKSTIKELNNKFNSYAKVAIYISTYNKYKTLSDEYKKIFNKSKKIKFESQHRSELLSFDFAKKFLDENQINLNLDLKTLNNKNLALKQEVDSLTKDFKFMLNQMSNLKEAKNLIDNILNETTQERDIKINKNVYRNQEII